MKKPTADRVRELLRYDAITGEFAWRVRPYRSKTRVDDKPGCIREGYLFIGIDGGQFAAHCLAWLCETGAWPASELDHRDTNGLNNSFRNLREATRTINNQNRRHAEARNRTGLLGVSRKGQRFPSRITVDGKKRHLGTFDTAQAAHQAYLAAKRELHAGNTL